MRFCWTSPDKDLEYIDVTEFCFRFLILNEQLQDKTHKYGVIDIHLI